MPNSKKTAQLTEKVNNSTYAVEPFLSQEEAKMNTRVVKVIFQRIF